MKRRYRVRIEVEHNSRDAAILKFEDLVFKLKAEHWPEDNIDIDGSDNRPKTSIAVGPLPPSIEDRIRAIEAEIDTRLGGISEENAA